MFRYPRDTDARNQAFYQRDYHEEGITSELPAPAELEALKTRGFAGTDRDCRAKIEILKAIVPTGRVLDYGASWGYGSWQLKAAGYDPLAFEISRPRAAFARDALGLPILTTNEELAALPNGSIDIVFASHVLEHLPRLAEPLQTFSRILRPGGVLAVFVPNCTGIEEPAVWREKNLFAIGEKHTIAFDAAFFERNLPAYGFETRTFTEPYPDAKAIATSGSRAGVSGYELTALARKLAP